MERVKLAGGVTLSRLVYGLWRLTDDDDTSDAHVQAKIESCLAQGITSLDQAAVYGGFTSEALLGRALKSAPRLKDRIEIVTKCGIVFPAGRFADARVKHYDTSRAHIMASVDNSLALMGIEAIDLLLIHRPDPFMDHGETGRALDDLVDAGKVRAVGVSNFRPHDCALLQSAMAAPIASNQIQLGLGHTAPFTNGDIADMQMRAMAPMAWSPLGGGTLMANAPDGLAAAMDEIAAREGVDRAAVAVAWILAHPARILPVLGTNNLERIARLSEATHVGIDRQDWFRLYQLAMGHEIP